MTKVPFTEARQNLLEFYQHFPHEGTVVDIIDSAYVAGLDDWDKAREELLVEILTKLHTMQLRDEKIIVDDWHTGYFEGMRAARHLIKEYLLNDKRPNQQHPRAAIHQGRTPAPLPADNH